MPLLFLVPKTVHLALQLAFSRASVGLQSAFKQDRGLGRRDALDRADNRCPYRCSYRLCCVARNRVERNGCGLRTAVILRRWLEEERAGREQTAGGRTQRASAA